MLNVSDLNVFYGQQHVLHGISFAVEEGECVAIIGSNGAGKSTLLRTISGLVVPTSGKIALNGERINGFAPHEITSRGVVQVPEGRKLFSNMTVEENLEIGAYVKRAKKNKEKNLTLAYKLFPILDERKHQTAATLSGGEQQMLAIARSLMADPKILLIDEFSMGIAPVLMDQLFSTVEELNAGGLTVIMVEQNVYSALSTADRAYVLENGKIVLEGSDLLHSDLVRKSYLGA